jgi:hypothetical protein
LEKVTIGRDLAIPQADLSDEIRQLCEINQGQYRMIRRLEVQSLLWESVAETRADLIRNLRAALGVDPDVNDEEEQLQVATIYKPRQS